MRLLLVVLLALPFLGGAHAQPEPTLETYRARLGEAVVYLSRHSKDQTDRRYITEAMTAVSALDFRKAKRASVASIASSARGTRLVIIGEAHRRGTDRLVRMIRCLGAAMGRRPRVLLDEGLLLRDRPWLDRVNRGEVERGSIRRRLTRLTHQFYRTVYPGYPRAIQPGTQPALSLRVFCAARASGFALAPLDTVGAARRVFIAKYPAYTRQPIRASYTAGQRLRDRDFAYRIEQALSRGDAPFVVAIVGAFHALGPGRITERLAKHRPLVVLSWSGRCLLELEHRFGRGLTLRRGAGNPLAFQLTRSLFYLVPTWRGDPLRAEKRRSFLALQPSITSLPSAPDRVRRQSESPRRQVRSGRGPVKTRTAGKP